MADSDRLSKEDLRKLAAELDAGGDRVVSEPVALQAAPEKEADTTSPPDVHLSQEEAEKEYLKQHPEEIPKDDRTAESSDTIDLDKSKDQKDKDRLERNWKKMQEREAAAKALMEEATLKHAELSRKERQVLAKQEPSTLMEEKEILPNGERGYSVKQYQDAAKQLREEGRLEMALEAEGKARDIYTAAFMKIWNANLETLQEDNPDLSDSRKPISKKCNEVLNALPFLKSIPDGCVYAYRIAQGDTSKSMISELKAENDKLKQEVDKLSKATRLTGSGPAYYSGSDKSFDSMTKAERKAHLRHLARQADMGYLPRT